MKKNKKCKECGREISKELVLVERDFMFHILDIFEHFISSYPREVIKKIKNEVK